MKRPSLNTTLSIAALILAGALVFFAFRYNQRTGEGWVQFPPLPPLPSAAEWLGKPFTALNNDTCSATYNSQTLSLIRPENGASSTVRLVDFDLNSGEWFIQPDKVWFCPVRGSDSKFYGVSHVTGDTAIYIATVKAGTVTTEKLDMPSDGLVSTDWGYYAYITGQVQTSDGYHSVLPGSGRIVGVLNLSSGTITTLATDATSTYLRLLGWSEDQKTLGYEITNMTPDGHGGYNVETRTERIDVSQIFPHAEFTDG